MGKSIKLKNDNFWDTRSIMHDQRELRTLLNAGEVIYDVDLNTFIGKIRIGYGNNLKNAPYPYGWCINLPHPYLAETYNKQFFTSQGLQDLYIRDMAEGAWHVWKKVI